MQSLDKQRTGQRTALNGLKAIKRHEYKEKEGRGSEGPSPSQTLTIRVRRSGSVQLSSLKSSQYSFLISLTEE